MNTRSTGAIAIAALSIGVLAACAAGAPAAPEAEGDGTSTVALGTGNWIGYGPWHIAEDQGYFEEQGIEVEQTVFGASDRIAAFASGELDAANFALHSAYLLQQQGVEFKLVLLQDYSLEADGVLAGAGIDEPADLAGKRVAYEPASASEIMIAAALDAGGLTLDDVTPVPLSAADGAAALLSGQVDASVTYEPYISPALGQDPNLSAVFTGADVPGLVSDVLLIRDDFIESDPDAAQGLVSAWGQAIDFYESDTEAAQAIIAAGVGESDPAALADAFDGVTFFGADGSAEELAGGEYRETVMPMMLERAADAGIVEDAADIDLDALVDTQFVESARE